LAGAVEQFARAVGEEIVFAALQQRDVRLSVSARASQQRGGCRDRRSIADRDMPHVADQPRNHVGEQLLGEEVHLIPPLKGEGGSARSAESGGVILAIRSELPPGSLRSPPSPQAGEGQVRSCRLLCI